MKQQYLEALQERIDELLLESKIAKDNLDAEKFASIANHILGMYEAKEIIMKTYNKIDEE